MDKQIKEAFDRIHAEEAWKQQAKENMRMRLSEEDCGQPEGGRRRNFGTWALRCGIAVVSIFLLVTVGILNRSVDAKASYIRLEGAVSVGLSLDGEDQVTEAQGLDSQGEQLVENLSLEGMSYRKAVDCILEGSSQFTEGVSEIKTEVTVEGQDEDKCRRMEKEVTKQCNGHRYGRQYGGSHKGHHGR